MTKNFSRIMSGLVCLFLVAIALRGWMTAKKTPTPASAGVVEDVPAMSVVENESTNVAMKIQMRVTPRLGQGK